MKHHKIVDLLASVGVDAAYDAQEDHFTFAYNGCNYIICICDGRSEVFTHKHAMLIFDKCRHKNERIVDEKTTIECVEFWFRGKLSGWLRLSQVKK